MNRSLAIVCLLLAIISGFLTKVGFAENDRPKRILLIGQGPDGHPKGTHEYRHGMAIMAKLLSRVPGIQTIVVSADGDWKEGPELLDSADAAVLFVSEGAKWIQASPKRFAAFNQFAKRGGGLACLHWAMGTRDAKNIAGFVKLFGGCHGGPDRRYKVVNVKMKLRKHPITTGVGSLHLKEEFYFKLKQPQDKSKLTSLVRVNIEGADHTVSWAWNRPDGGRSFGFSGLHFHENWKHPTYRRLIGQAALWVTRVPIPDKGLDVNLEASNFVLPETQSTE